MGRDQFLRKKEGLADSAQIRPRKPGTDCPSCMFGLWKDPSRCQLRRNSRHSREAQMDHQARKQSSKTREEAYEFAHDVQKQ